MVQKPTQSIGRRRVIQVLGAGSLAAVAGCLGDDDDDDGTDDEAADDGMDGDDNGAETELLSMDPTPEGQSLSDDDIAALIDAFDDQPMNDDQHVIEGEIRDHTPRHIWKWVSDETFIGLHFDDPNPEEANDLDYILIGQKGLFTEESQPGNEFSHFHQHTAEDWDSGHGGETGDEGYWLTHIAVRNIEYPFHADEIDPQVDYNFNPTPPESGTTGHDTSWDAPDGGEGDLSDDDRDELLEIFDDDWANEDQHDAPHGTPAHVWKWVSEDTFMFLHWDNPAVEEADNLIYFGIGERGQFSSNDIPAGQDDEFTHFHLHEADSWEAGHGGADAEQWGAWLVHHAVRPLEMDWGDVDVGVDRNFMITEPPE